MSKKYFLFIVVLLTFVIANCQPSIKAEPEIFIRFNQVGYLPSDIKSAVILSSHSLEGKKISIKSIRSNQNVNDYKFGKSLGRFGNFSFSYRIDFTALKKMGEYYFQYSSQKTFSFKIGENVYNGIADSLLGFFKVQRCGYTNPFLHEVCHISDAAQLIDGETIINKKIDVTGGWHDAGDYVKFLNTTAFSTYMLLFSYEFDKTKFSSDKNKNNVPDILEEAKIGLDWMLRAYYDKNKLVTQVQDLRDQGVGWRLPENDAVGYDRPAFLGIGKNLIGIYSATMALAYRIWSTKLNYPEFANQCLNAAQNLYSIHKTVPDVDSSGTGVYLDKSYEGKMALGAVELYLSTNKNNYLNDAAAFADLAGPDLWWSWGNINSLAHYRLAKIIPKYSDYIKLNLEEFNRKKNDNLFGKGVSLSWGTNVTLLGISLQNILFKKLTNDARFDSLDSFSRDYILGRNQWGVSFINGYGKNYTRNFHHQVAHFKGRLPGGFSAGPAAKELVDKANMPLDKNDKYARFQTSDSYYRDDRNDYITNEPTITGNATAIFVFRAISKK
ncbi:MAG: glycoside hydrolase family 9 [Ignavibacteria bacterium]|nr:MAG: glycoside hydrolase family 9 [Ignavibacteria bacterium]KAF0158685.1 MAG: glycoside hydrolase family 9 [Ignavibacteria bacterium]